jgi:hypothetical protein
MAEAIVAVVVVDRLKPGENSLPRGGAENSGPYGAPESSGHRGQ